jgi:energy-coupling factor transport system substrate-specific component
VSWSLGSIVLLGVALGVGFLWYERSHPPAKVVALVATLAALAAVGRIAFAPVPNVKPTTDVVLIAGYALGGVPGFVVGAVAALASNLFFGQGPWTPWQMTAWGLVGVLGAVLARVSGRDMGRVALALWCGVAGFAFGLVMDLSTWVTFAGDQTLDRFLFITGTSLPWNLAHAIGNVVFFLAFGPVLVRALERFRSRFEVTWRPLPAASGPLAIVALVALAAPGLAPARADAAAGSPSGAAVAYLQGAQNADGGWGPAPRTSSTSMHSAWTVMGLAAAGVAPGAEAGAYVAGPGAATRGTADLERTILAITATGGDAGKLAAELRTRQRGDGSFEGLVNVSAFAVLALRAAGAGPGDDAVRRAAAFVAGEQNADGGFTYARRGAPSGTDDTGAALMALAAAGRGGSPAARRAVDYLHGHRNGDGGWPLATSGPSNSQSTAWAVQALIAAHGGGTAPGLAFLRRMQASDGAIRYSRTSGQTPVWVTAQGLAALAGRPLPVAGVAPAAPAQPPAAPQGAGDGSGRSARGGSGPGAGEDRSPPAGHGGDGPRSRSGRPARLRARATAALTGALAPGARAAGAATAVLFGALGVR